MIKLTGSVGKMGPNKKCDVAVIQAALMNLKRGALWPGPIDGKKTPKFLEAIIGFQTGHNISPANGTIQTFGPTMNRLKEAVQMSTRDLMAIPGTAIVYVPTAGAREAEKEAEDTKRKAPFPKLEAEALAAIQKAVGENAGLCLERAKDSVTKEGCFQTELDFAGVKWLDPRSGKPLMSGREPQGVTNYVWSLIGSGTPWRKGSPQDLVFKSKRQLKSMKDLGTGPLSPDNKKLLQLTSPPSTPILIACAKGIANLLRSGRATLKEGREEAGIIIEAASNADPAFGKKLAQAAGQDGIMKYKDHTLYLVARRALSRDDAENNSIPGHVFIGGKRLDGATEAWGFYPKEPWKFGTIFETKRTVDGKIDNDLPKFTQALSGDPDYRFTEYKVDRFTYDRTMSLIRTYGERNDYGLFTNSCVHAAFGVLNEVGVIKSFGTVFGALPKAIYDFIPGLKASTGQ